MITVFLALLAGMSAAQPPVDAAREEADSPALTQEAAEGILRARGLTRAGEHWLCSEDLRLRTQLDALEQHQRRFHRARRTCAKWLEENENTGRLLADNVRRVAQLERQAASTSDPALRRQWADGLARLRLEQSALRQRYRTPDQVPDDAGPRDSLIEWTNARNALAVAALTYLETDVLYRIRQRYEALRGDVQAQRALAALGQRLGGGFDFAAAAPRVAEARRTAMDAAAPLYRVGGQWRSNLLIGPATPANCTLVDQGPPLVLPESVARAAGLLPRGKTFPRRTFVARDGRTLDVSAVRASQLWLGGQEITGLEALVLPPHGEDLGVLLDVDYLSGYRVKRQPQQLRLDVEKAL